MWLIKPHGELVTRYKERYLNVVHYGERPDAAGPQLDKTKGNQVVSDWNRMMAAGQKAGETCPYYINGKNLRQLRTGNAFLDIADLKNFLKHQLLYHVLTDDEKSSYEQLQDEHVTPEGLEAEKKLDALTEFSFMHCHQGGLPHATDFSLRTARTDVMRERIAVSKPETRVDFNASIEGLKICERNTYTRWQERLGSAEKIHVSLDKGKPFYAQTESTYLITPNTKNIELVQLNIDCPSKNLAPIFNKLDENQHVIQSMFDTIRIKLHLKEISEQDKTAEEGHAYFYKDGKACDSSTDTAPPSERSDSDSDSELEDVGPKV